MQVRVSKGADYRYIPRQRFAALPWNQCESVRPLAVDSDKADRLLGYRNACCGYSTGNDVIDGLLLLLWQVKEMENIIRKRHPNSLPALIWAAASLPDDPVTKPQSVAFLESRILKLETELASKDEEAKKSMRALEQKYNSVKV